ncbi:hypothetical protein [Mycobacterium sp.]|uniref:hypothetical protein n=1 Tax=Mycobacterium sp. TaxID=1785 RepID=UPI0025EAEE38|nr:hypothetical protein [Mycobacterium sp.]
MTTADQPHESDPVASAQQPRNSLESRRRSGDVRREGSFCSCGMQLSLTGICVNCD